MARILRLFIFVGILGLAAFFYLTRPVGVDPDDFANLVGDPSHGTQVFHAAGCASCHAAPKTDFSDHPILSGGQKFPSPFGTFNAPNISPDPQNGIGGWTLLEFANAVQAGVSPDGAHYYPAFPYTAYAKMRPQDVADLKSFMDALPISYSPSLPHDVGFPFNIRRTLGGWKLLFANSDWVLTNAESPEIERGRYLVEALAHCGECHTPRNALGGLKRGDWLQGAFIPGEGKVPAIASGQLDWAPSDIAYYLETGFTPEFDSAGGAMTHVVENMGQLSASDRESIAAYLKLIP
ncbi:cytochrome c [Cognatishimia sp. WU-CL00825]|uniref:c-type cytochrome n=1 Tax=Cognatishimia sp. WU-CL00825 TaxID=3127658 RepID=UPI0031043C75